MRDFAGKVAVITGGGGTFGQAMATCFARAGARLVLADLRPEALDPAVLALRALGADVIGVPTDVSDAASVDALAQRALDAFGAVHIVANNAGVAPIGAVWESTTADLQWSLGGNLWGVIHGVRVFTPILLRQGVEGHIINVASVAGLISPPGMGAYNVSKHAVVALTESLHNDLALVTDQVRCSVVCPAYFPSGISNSEAARPDALKNSTALTEQQLEMQRMLEKAVSSGRVAAADIAELVIDAVRERKFYVLSHPRIKGAIQARMEDILAEHNPRDPMRLG